MLRENIATTNPKRNDPNGTQQLPKLTKGTPLQTTAMNISTGYLFMSLVQYCVGEGVPECVNNFGGSQPISIHLGVDFSDYGVLLNCVGKP